jgi:hypothetical protein
LNRMYCQMTMLMNEEVEEETEDAPLRVLPAPPRTCLKMFGGYMDIAEFRAKTLARSWQSSIGMAGSSRGTMIDVMEHPFTFVPQQIEEINEADVTQPLKFIPVDHDHINQVKEKLQLKRTKPLVNSKNTLDHVMNVRISHA